MSFLLVLAASVLLRWDPVLADDLTGYRLYVGIQSIVAGNLPVQIIDLGLVVRYRVRGLTAGDTYYFVVTAVCPEGESGFSNEVTFTPKLRNHLLP